MTLKDWIQIAISLAGMVFGPLLAVKLSIRQFHSQKLWEKKVEVYQQLISDVSELYEYYSESFMATISGTSHPSKVGLGEAQRTLERHGSAGGFIISTEAEQALQNALAAMQGRDYDNAQDAYDSISAALKENLALLKTAARNDCKFD